jgi:transaldolase
MTNTGSLKPPAKRPRTRILVDGGDPDETRAVKDLLGFVDGQTTNPSLIAKNPDIAKLVRSGRKLTPEQEADEYRRIVRAISPLVGDAGVSIEVFGDLHTTAERMYQQGRDMFSWIPNAYVKYPCTSEGLKAAEQSVREGIRVNMTLCFSQEQAAAVYGATRGTRDPAYVSPFIGRIDDIGQNGVDVVSNIKRMYSHGDGHVLILAASIRSLRQLLYCFSIDADLVTVPAKILREWADAGLPQPDAAFRYEPQGTRIEYREIDLEQPWQRFNVEHPLTTKGVEKFAADYRATVYPKAG